ncbi:MAG: ribonuclease HII [Deltaproteobacteria bacterium]|jgi:ribonuclease HII|nr:ribonuclease HII [Deltaproteobacteria bacterium]
MEYLILGVDEAGRGPLAGPVTAAGVIFPVGYRNEAIKDSKKLSARQREELFETIIRKALAYSVISVGQCRIDKLNILGATKLAMFYAVKRVYQQLIKQGLDLNLKILIDGNQLITPLANSDFGSHLSQEAIVKGDAKVMQIAAASILAKVSRDRLMGLIAKKYPGYNFEGHKGYPTPEHYLRIQKLGISKAHRKTFRLA